MGVGATACDLLAGSGLLWCNCLGIRWRVLVSCLTSFGFSGDRCTFGFLWLYLASFGVVCGINCGCCWFSVKAVIGFQESLFGKIVPRSGVFKEPGGTCPSEKLLFRARCPILIRIIPV